MNFWITLSTGMIPTIHRAFGEFLSIILTSNSSEYLLNPPAFVLIMLVLIFSWQSSLEWQTWANANRCQWWSEKTKDCITILNGLVLVCWVLWFCSFLTCHSRLTWSHCSLAMFPSAGGPLLSTAAQFSRITATCRLSLLTSNNCWNKGGHWCEGYVIFFRAEIWHYFWRSFVFLSVYKPGKHRMP